MFGNAGRTRNIQNVASFFLVKEITEKWQKRICAMATSFPLSFIYFFVASKSDTMVNKLLTKLPLDDKSDDLFIQLLTFVSDTNPAIFSPIILLLLSYLIFASQLTFLYRKIEYGMLYISGFATRANDITHRYATLLLRRNEFDDLVNILEGYRKSKLPLAEELENAHDATKLSFFLLYMAKPDIPRIGLKDSLLEIADRKLSKLLSQNEYRAFRGRERTA
ncbi:MAG: hypothetical protein OXC10_07065 [Rhodospirillaceae bacterium]|nr:hypothetical protein [Rhodospirillaceae bacterium]